MRDGKKNESTDEVENTEYKDQAEYCKIGWMLSTDHVSESLFLSSRHGGDRRRTGASGTVSAASSSGLSAVDAAATIGHLQ